MPLLRFFTLRKQPGVVISTVQIKGYFPLARKERWFNALGVIEVRMEEIISSNLKQTHKKCSLAGQTIML